LVTPKRASSFAAPCRAIENAEQQMLGADVLVTEALCFVLRILQDFTQAVAG
jgi:hypothetical protein